MNTFSRFVLVGVLNTAVGYAAILFFQYVAATGYLAANALGYMIGGALSYLLNRSFTFDNTRAHRAALPRFVLAVASCYLLNLVVLELGVTHWQLPAAAAQGLAVICYTTCFYLVSKRLVFRHRARGPQA